MRRGTETVRCELAHDRTVSSDDAYGECRDNEKASFRAGGMAHCVSSGKHTANAATTSELASRDVGMAHCVGSGKQRANAATTSELASRDVGMAHCVSGGLHTANALKKKTRNLVFNHST